MPLNSCTIRMSTNAHTVYSMATHLIKELKVHSTLKQEENSTVVQEKELFYPFTESDVEICQCYDYD